MGVGINSGANRNLFATMFKGELSNSPEFQKPTITDVVHGGWLLGFQLTGIILVAVSGYSTCTSIRACGSNPVEMIVSFGVRDIDTINEPDGMVITIYAIVIQKLSVAGHTGKILPGNTVDRVDATLFIMLACILVHHNLTA